MGILQSKSARTKSKNSRSKPYWQIRYRRQGWLPGATDKFATFRTEREALTHLEKLRRRKAAGGALDVQRFDFRDSSGAWRELPIPQEGGTA